MTQAVAAPVGLTARPWTYADLEALAEDGYRYEIIEGTLHVSPPPGLPHAGVLAALVVALDQPARDAGLRVLPGAGVWVTDRTYLIPDLLVARADAVTTAVAGRPPARAPAGVLVPAGVALVVEIVSPSSVTHDEVTKRSAYAAAGITHYWIIDPAAVGRMVALALTEAGAYAEIGRAEGEAALTINAPVAVSLSPAALTR